jgi:hypothetical protein
MWETEMNQTKYSMSKKAFEELLCSLVDSSKLAVRAYKEETDRSAEYPTYTTVNLYYFEGKHIASWHQGKAWIFNHILETAKEPS